MKKSLLSAMDKNQIEELLYHALRTIYLFERTEIELFGLDYQQMYLLKYLKRSDPLRVSETAEKLRIQVFAATRLIDQLEKKKLITRTRDVKDRRNIYIRLSAQGEDMVARIEVHTIEMILARLSGYTDEQLGIMLDLIRNIDVILGVANGLPGSTVAR
ncbi:MAG TPA: MarR family transcriptional regulator [Spirochaetota bacterium]|nr:MarR family transcriptional regulator [Spirochaetota bacterium]HPG50828.1 MarR family transcriptional regulator [Spirochaetota bacterium]HPN12238.1 MarR family transcriptional regulator [Spirochaetota bacterium]HQL83498.1 MarR family transcriptional regulator [Spirochaetota bacterium]